MSVLSAIKDLLDQDGIQIYDLGQPYQPGMPHHPHHPPFAFVLIKRHGDFIYPNGVSTASCLFTLGGHTGTHLDGLGHVSKDGRMYRDVDPNPYQTYEGGLTRHGIETTPPIIRRGVLLDIAGLKRVDTLSGGYEITDQDLAQAEERQEVQVKTGDVLLVRTGWMRYWDELNRYIAYGQDVPGVGVAAAEWMVDRGISYTGSDTVAYERTSVDRPGLAVHTLLIRDHGIQIMEMVNLETLAQDGIYEFLFIAIPLKIVGGTASPIRPIAIV
ncbi:MAG: cyclase family protein [Candidatus Bipolaricaulia bacterium]